MAIDKELEKLVDQVETRLEKQLSAEVAKVYNEQQKWHAVYTKEEPAKLWARLKDEQDKEQKRIDKNIADGYQTMLKAVTSPEAGIKRLEARIEVLIKDLAALKKDAISSADLKPLLDRVKALEKSKG